MREAFLNSAAVRFLDRDQVLSDLRRAAGAARAKYPEIARVLLFGSFARGDWTADSDADLIVIVRKEFADLFERARYQIYCTSIPTDTLVYSEREFEQLSRDPGSFLTQNLPSAWEL